MTFPSTKEYTWSCKKCNIVFRTRKDLQNHYIENPDHRKIKIRDAYVCPHCGIIKNTTKEGITIHIKYCKSNPNAEKYPQRIVSEEARHKMSESKKRAYAEGRITKTGWIDRQKKKRSYAEQWLKNYIDNNCHDKNYKEDYPIKNYLLDFAWVDKQICIEMDGEQHYTNKQRFESDRRKDCLLQKLGWKILRIRWKECVIDKKQFENIIFNFIEKSEIIPFEKRYKSKKDIKKEYSESLAKKRSRITKKEIQRRFEIIKPYFDNKKYGWIKKCSNETKLSPHQIQYVCSYFDLNWKTKKQGEIV